MRTRTALWLLGHGVAQSPSPAMQNAALRACGLDWEYSIRDVSPGELPQALDQLRGGEARGANVTIPHKRAVAQACDELRGDAAATGAVNTVLVEEGGRLVGENTDARGLEGALRESGLWPAPGASVVVLGAGGAAAAAVLALGRALPRSITVAARSAAAAQALAAQCPGGEGIEWTAVGQRLGRLSSHGAPAQVSPLVLVNATPVGLDALPVDITSLPPGTTVVDLRYRPRPVDLVEAARAHGLRAGDGLDMLLHQGMLAFELWTGRQAPWDAARAALYQAVGA